MTIPTLDAALQHLAGPPADPVAALIDLVAALRPRKRDDGAEATRNLQALCHLLNSRVDLRAALRRTLLRLLAERKAVSLYVDAGVFPGTGFFTESARRLSRTLLPDVPDPAYLKDVVGMVFHQPGDAGWIGLVDEQVWLDVLAALHLDETDAEAPAGANALGQVLEALRVVSYRISAIGLEPELVRIEPKIEEFESPFLAQNVELVGYLERCVAAPDLAAAQADYCHVLVLLDQCRAIVERIRGRAGREGTSLSLTFHLRRLGQLLDRAEMLLGLVQELRGQPSPYPAATRLVALWKTVVRAECRRHDLRHYWRQNVELMARRVTENASRTGEHYITETRGEYFTLLRSAALGGFIIAFMALMKLEVAKAHLPPLTEALLFCLNYGLGFVLIHILHGTVATKQPAMTANTIAATLSEGQGKLRDMRKLAGLVARLFRSQIAAIIGNVGVAVPVAMLIGMTFHTVAGEHLIDPGKAAHLLADVDPLHSGALFYAAVAGVCLFLSSLVAGFYDNAAAYNRIPERLLQLKWPRRLLGDACMYRVAEYVRNNLGALAGNLSFGFMLGGVTAFGVLFGLPVDIRHIAFSSAYLGYAAVAFDFSVAAKTMAWAALGVGLIGLINLTMSFALALFVALRARGVSGTSQRNLFRSLWQHLCQQPREFLLPPAPAKAEPAAADAQAGAAEAATPAGQEGREEPPGRTSSR